MAGRSRYATAILGPELAAKLPEVKVLLVGAGGIGCEVREYCDTPFSNFVIEDDPVHSEEHRSRGLRSHHAT